MGAIITVSAPAENRSLIDWFAWTLKVTDPDEALHLSGLDSLPFAPASGGVMGYKKSKRCGNITIYYDGSEGMGCHVSMSGQGCRQFEAYKAHNACWYRLFVQLSSVGASFTRIDLAVDNVDGGLDLDLLEKSIDEKQVRSRFKSGHKHINFSFTDTPSKKDEGRTIYLGSPQSRLKIRFYDKAAQYDINSHWVRCEIQCMAERATEAVKHLMKGVPPGPLAVSVLNNYFAPINLDNSNKSRCSVQQWWSEWLITTDKLRLTTAKAMKYVQESMDYLKRQYSPTLAMCRKFLGTIPFNDFIHDLLQDGKERLTRKHEMIIQCSSLSFDISTDLPF